MCVISAHLPDLPDLTRMRKLLEVRGVVMPCGFACAALTRFGTYYRSCPFLLFLHFSSTCFLSFSFSYPSLLVFIFHFFLPHSLSYLRSLGSSSPPAWRPWNPSLPFVCWPVRVAEEKEASAEIKREGQIFPGSLDSYLRLLFSGVCGMRQRKGRGAGRRGRAEDG
ncbi:hypothetical protein BC567DRAFT_228097 [Phyllosticta citribraziliensis]